MNTADYLLARCSPDDVALVDSGRSFTYRELQEAAAKIAGVLAARHLPAGSRVAIIGPNSLFWVAGYLAAMKLNHVAVPLSPKTPLPELRRQAQAVNCAAVLIDDRCSSQCSPAFDADRLIGEEAVDAPIDAYWPDATSTPADTDAALMLTSGSTARPKVVRVTHRNIQANTESIISYLALTPADRALVILPFFYCYGASLLHTHLRVGARLVLCNSFVFPETALDTLEREQCTIFAGVPSSFHLLLRAGSFAQRALPSLRLIQQAGGRLSPKLIDELLVAKPRARLFVMYGQTEATARLSYLPPELLAAKRGSIGKGIPGVDLRVLGEDGKPTPPGTPGEIYARGANISPGYLDDPQASADKFTSEGLRTGDLAVQDEDGFIFIVGRREDFIKSWGHRVSAGQVEEAALAMDGVLGAAAVGVPDDRAGEAVTLVVEKRTDARITPVDVSAHCSGRLPPHMVPRSVRIVDALPLTANGKVDKAALLDLALRGAGQEVSHAASAL
jgi:long-chain acyl-CoA synthetase